MINIDQKKGDPKALSGKMIAYAFVNQENEVFNSNSPINSMIQSGILAVIGEYNEQMNLNDFLKKEFGDDIDNNMNDLLSQINQIGNEDININIDDLKEKMKSFSGNEMIPIPAKIAFFSSEDEILAQEADIYCLGTFKIHSNAHLGVTSFPILYQAIFREQQSSNLEKEISSLLGDIETGKDSKTSVKEISNNSMALTLNGTLNDYEGDLDQLLLNKILPKILFNLEHAQEFKLSIENLKKFMKPFPFPDAITDLIKNLEHYHQNGGQNNRKLELLCHKISALYTEEYEQLKTIQDELDQLN